MNVISAENHGWFHWQPPPQCKGKYTWRANKPGWIPPRALAIGKDKDGSPLYAGRAFHEGDLLPAKVRGDGSTAYVSWGGKEWKVDKFEVNIYR